MDKLLSRKFIYVMVAIVLSYTLVITGALKATDWLDFVKAMGVIYVAGNLGTLGIKRMSE